MGQVHALKAVSTAIRFATLYLNSEYVGLFPDAASGPNSVPMSCRWPVGRRVQQEEQSCLMQHQLASGRNTNLSLHGMRIMLVEWQVGTNSVPMSGRWPVGRRARQEEHSCLVPHLMASGRNTIFAWYAHHASSV